MSNLRRLKIMIRGAVQGVGFRPFIYRLAIDLNLKGWVNNSASGVFIDVEGNQENLDTFLKRIPQEKPPRSQIQALETTWLTPVNYQKFEIRHSISGEKTAIILPDLATCSDCLQDIFDPNNRRYYYPFTNCTNCGPRYTIIKSLPYDRPGTSMRNFIMCEVCQKEYKNPLDRRFHAQPNACPNCGPKLEFWDKNGAILARETEALNQAIHALKNGKILAIKGLGGFYLMVDAKNEQAIQELRKRKYRPDKPFALMYPSLKQIKLDCEVSEIEAKLLTSAEAPIVLLKRQKDANLNHKIAPNNPYLGVMLPYTPLHHLLLKELNCPLVATSGNLSDEPICIHEQEALQRLNNIADLFLVHNRPIIRPVDDSIVRVIGGREMVIRRARGYAPFPIKIQDTLNSIEEQAKVNHKVSNSNILAVGGHLKNTVAILKDYQVFMSQHIGDLGTKEALNSFHQVMESLKKLYEFEPDIIVSDAHPDYVSSQYASAQNLPLIKVQHHHAHVLACMADNNIKIPVLGVAWDGTGYGNDGTIWGGEFLLITDNDCQRIAHFRPFKLPGGQQAVKETRRIALGILYEIFRSFNQLKLPFFKTISQQELNLVKIMLARNLNSPFTSSIGRLFDGVAAILGLCEKISFEGQGAMSLEYAINDLKTDEYYSYEIKRNESPWIVDWELMMTEIIEDSLNHIPIPKIAAKFHNTLVEIMINIAQKIEITNIALTGGCFQNKYLTERAIFRLKQEKFAPFWHRKLPPNDGGLALGQIIASRYLIQEQSKSIL